MLKKNGRENTKAKPEGKNRMSLYAIKREKLRAVGGDGYKKVKNVKGSK